MPALLQTGWGFAGEKATFFLVLMLLKLLSACGEDLNICLLSPSSLILLLFLLEKVISFPPT